MNRSQPKPAWNLSKQLPLKRLAAFILSVASVLAPSLASAFAVFPDGSGGFLKWGGSNAEGTPGGIVTWGFIPAGTAGSVYCDTVACPGTSVSDINIENAPGAGYTLTTLSSLQSAIDAAFDTWSAVANISFVGPNADGGLAINDPAATQPDIRIGVFAFASGGGAVGFAPPPNGGTGAGDILFDANSFYAFQSGAEDAPFPVASTAPNDFQSLLIHELGHALGLDHPPIDGNCPVMQIEPNCLGIVNRTLDTDDIAGIQFLYGQPVPLPASFWLLGSALFAMTGAVRRRRR